MSFSNNDSNANTGEEVAASLLVTMKQRELSNEESAEACDVIFSILCKTVANSSSSFPIDDNDENEPTILKMPSETAEDNENQPTYPSGMPISLACPEDAEFLSPLQCYIRTQLTEYFAADSQDFPAAKKKSKKAKASSKSSAITNTRQSSNEKEDAFFVTPGRRTPVCAGRVGIRCVFCKNVQPGDRAPQAISFPSQISGIYSSVVMLQCRHFPYCQQMPEEVRDEIARLKKAGNHNSSHSTGEGRQQYWERSAREAGFIDTESGIRFKEEPRPRKSVVNFEDESETKITNNNSTGEDTVMFESIKKSATPAITKAISSAPSKPKVVTPTDSEPVITLPRSIKYDLLIQGSHLVSIDDKDLVPGYIFLALAQMKPCIISPDDRVGSYKTRPLNFLGMCCKHCEGRSGPGFGKFFPNSLRSLAQTTTTQTIVKHIALKCKKCPSDIKETVAALLREADNSDKPAYAPRGASESDGRPKYGSRKEFFQRVWDRLHGSSDATTMETDAISDFGSVVTALSSNHQDSAISSLKKKLFHNPIQQVVSVSSYSFDDEGSDVSLHADESLECEDTDAEDAVSSSGTLHSVEDAISASKVLLDDKNRRITVSGHGLISRDHKRAYVSSTMDTPKKRTRAL
mmetsp:Transcript_7958/g.16649  ORF Transcript_7958/g.16649 Transcript_7958/m.16649 type:complete len:633 (+) Transcript_7958:87-1985(+)